MMRKIIWLEKIPYEPFKKKVIGEDVIGDTDVIKPRYSDDGDEYRLDIYDADGHYIKCFSIGPHDDYRVVEE